MPQLNTVLYNLYGNNIGRLQRQELLRVFCKHAVNYIEWPGIISRALVRINTNNIAVMHLSMLYSRQDLANQLRHSLERHVIFCLLTYIYAAQLFFKTQIWIWRNDFMHPGEVLKRCIDQSLALHVIRIIAGMHKRNHQRWIAPRGRALRLSSR